MNVFFTIAEIQEYSLSARAQGKQIGFVPTMGALHPGHIELVNRARGENDIVICSIFVNPIQFNNPADLEKYPRTLEKDIELLTQASCDAVFCPSAKEMYPQPDTHEYDFGNLDKVMEGRFRKGHFNGVAIVVKKLFDMVLPHKSYFGEKDFQQLAIIKALVRMEQLPVEIIPCPIVREADGLAMSSRNVRLSPEHRRQAPLIYQCLKKAALMYPHHTIEEVMTMVETTIAENPFMELEYFEISDTETLDPVRGSAPKKPVVACIAVFMGEVRLIDNMVFNL